MNSDDNQNPPPTMQELVVKMCNVILYSYVIIIKKY